MPDVTINNHWIFTDEARTKFGDVQVSLGGPPPLAPFLVPGDLVFEAFSALTFEVKCRAFRFRSETQLDVTYLLDLPLGVNQSPYSRLVDPAPKQEQ